MPIVPLILVGVGLVSSFLAWLFANRRFRPVETPAEGCLVCASTNLVVIAGGAYRCSSCGYEGGPGWAAHRDALLLSQYATLDPAARLAGIRNDLQSAHDHLVAAVGELGLASSFWPKLAFEIVEERIFDELPLLASDLPDVSQLTLDAIGRVATAQRSVHEAKLKVRSGPTTAREPILLVEINWQDNPTASVHVRVGHARTTADAMLRMVDEQLRIHFEYAHSDSAH